MGVLRVTRERRATVGFLLALLLLTTGAGLAWGEGYALMVAGALLLGWFLVLYDVEDEGQ